jgi:type I restriction enzyme S subunit
MKTLTQTPLGEIMATRAGTVDPAQYPKETFDLYSIPAFDKGEPEVLLGQEIGSTKQVVQPGDVLLSKIVPHIRRSWVVVKDRGRRLIASSEWIVFRSDRFHSPYLRHVLTSDPFHVQFMGTVAGVGGSLLRARPAQVAGLSIPLPPLPEQRRIADILDKADAIRRKRQEAIEIAESLLGSSFQGLFGDPVANTAGYKQIAIGDADILISDGNYSSKYPKAEDFLTSGVPFIRANNLKRGTVVDDDMRFISHAQHSELRKGHLLARDVLLVTRGSIGEVGLVAPKHEGSNINAQLVLLRPRSAQFTSEFLVGFFSCPSVRSQLIKFQTGTALQQLPVGKLVQIRLPLAPEDHQRAFSRFFQKHLETLELLTRTLDTSTELFNSLVQRAFRGEF